MKQLVLSCTLVSALLSWASPSLAEAPSFDPEQPFQAFSSQMLRALLNQALDVLEDHIEVAGEVSGPNSKGDQSGRLQLKLYPNGKSQSDEHLKAEGWFSISPDIGRHDFHFRLQRQDDSPRLPSQHPDSVL